ELAYGDILSGLEGWDWNSDGYLGGYGNIYGGTNRVVYPSNFLYESRHPSGDRIIRVGGLTLRDSLSGNVIRQIENRIGFIGVQPQWSPNGENFVISNSPFNDETSKSRQELFLVDSEGNITRLTYLTDFYDTAYLGRASWSPDGKYIAFWLDFVENRDPNPLLSVVNVATREVVNYCIRGNWYTDTDSEFGLSWAPVWSPDSNYLVVESNQPDSTRQTYLVSLDEFKAYQIFEYTWAVGWMLPPD
ncbi:MAG TPA: hypothetical protein VLK33_11765, partial [Terriglobales bacterium]|nr:hypothetical protein [Terriglobales bacterium]